MLGGRREQARPADGQSPADGRLSPKSFWDELWTKGTLRPYPDRKRYSDRRFIRLFESIATELQLEVLEVGCGNSRWLPYFAKEYRAQVWGIDYSEAGCQQANVALAAMDVHGTILFRDLFDANEDLRRKFRVVTSFGLVEHFADTAQVVGLTSRFVAPRGVIVTIVPNMNGLIGAAQRLVDRTIYEQHKRISPIEFRRWHENEGFSTLQCGYFGSFDPAVVNEGRLSGLPGLILRGLRVLTRWIAWSIFSALRIDPETRLLSPYVVYVGRSERLPAMPSAEM